MIVNFPSDYENPLIQTTKVPLDRVGVIILGGGEGTRLAPLTKTRCKPAVSFGGRYSLIDVPISHSLSTGLSKIYVIGQYLAHTLQEHLHQTYLHHGITQNQLQLLVPEQGTKYKGTADAVRQNLAHFDDPDIDYFLILSGDQLYNINFQEMINFGVESDAGMLIATQPVGKREAKRMGLLKMAPGSSQVTDFYEKPQEEHILDAYFTDPFTLNRLGYDVLRDRHYLGSMGIYLFKKEVMFDLLREDGRDDFGKHLISTQLGKGDVHAYLYDGYWEDIGTIEAYYEANLALTAYDVDPKTALQCYDESFRLLTKGHHLPGVQISGCRLHETLACEGSIVEGREVSKSVLGVRSIIEEGSVVRNSILLGNQYYESSCLKKHRPKIGKECHIERAILDENVRLGDRVRLVNQHGHTHYDAPDGKLFVRDGIIIIPRGTSLGDDFVF